MLTDDTDVVSELASRGGIQMDGVLGDTADTHSSGAPGSSSHGTARRYGDYVGCSDAITVSGDNGSIRRSISHDVVVHGGNSLARRVLRHSPSRSASGQ